MWVMTSTEVLGTRQPRIPSPVGTADFFISFFSRPYGTKNFRPLIPSTEVLGYFQSLLTELKT
jgi:hypothetical protein